MLQKGSSGGDTDTFLLSHKDTQHVAARIQPRKQSLGLLPKLIRSLGMHVVSSHRPCPDPTSGIESSSALTPASCADLESESASSDNNERDRDSSSWRQAMVSYIWLSRPKLQSYKPATPKFQGAGKDDRSSAHTGEYARELCEVRDTKIHTQKTLSDHSNSILVVNCGLGPIVVALEGGLGQQRNQRNPPQAMSGRSMDVKQADRSSLCSGARLEAENNFGVQTFSELMKSKECKSVPEVLGETSICSQTALRTLPSPSNLSSSRSYTWAPSSIAPSSAPISAKTILTSVSTMSPQSATDTAKTDPLSFPLRIQSFPIQSSPPESNASKATSSGAVLHTWTDHKEPSLTESGKGRPRSARRKSPSNALRTNWTCKGIRIKTRRLDLNVTNEQGQTILFAAVSEGNVDAVREILQRGADIFARDHQGRRAFDLARKPDVKALLTRRRNEVGHANLSGSVEMNGDSLSLIRKKSIDLRWAYVCEEYDLESLQECLAASYCTIFDRC
eukprot:gb/GEZN01003621.1/.p1 GENE.gb/GEZN01003621.1/~~gb/GEZN01003621.1/.p1  ORF type:complete len:505 (+),score=22.42 gb/GEZN01003621.1/:109-1623(+)